jgi:HAD superfamily hydrolase (TIGR01509 family)
MPVQVILWDIMDTLVRDPFFTHMPLFFGHTFQELVKRLRPNTWVEFELGRMDEAEFYERFFLDGSAIDGPGLKQCMADAYAWIEGVEALLKELRSREVPMYALSNYPPWYRLVDERLGLAKYLDLSFISCLTGVRKPAPEAFLNPCQHLARAPEACLLIDDRAQNCEAARALGLSAIQFSGDVTALREELISYQLL